MTDYHCHSLSLAGMDINCLFKFFFFFLSDFLGDFHGFLGGIMDSVLCLANYSMLLFILWRDGIRD